MTRKRSALLGIGSIVYLPLSIVGLLAVNPNDAVSTSTESVMLIVFFALAALWLATIVLMVRHLYEETDLTSGRKAAWVVGLFVFGYIAAPLYWLIHVRRPPSGGPHRSFRIS